MKMISSSEGPGIGVPIREFDTGRLPKRIISGPGARFETGRLGAGKRCFVIASGSLRRSTGLVDDLVDGLGPTFAGVFDEVEAHNPAEQVDRAAAAARFAGADCIVTIGGGAVHDAGKGVALAAPNNRPILDLQTEVMPDGRRVLPRLASAPLPVVTVPATFSASEMLGGGLVSDREKHRKVSIFHPDIVPRAVILDGEVIALTPPAILATTGFNAIHHCLEALISKRASRISDALALSALDTLVGKLPDLTVREKPDIPLCQELVDASAMSGLTYANSGLGVGHAICHALGAHSGISHSAANAVIVPHALRFNSDCASQKLAIAARACGLRADGFDASDTLIHVLCALRDRLKLPGRLREIGLNIDDIPEVARIAAGDWILATNPRPAGISEIETILTEAW